MSNATIQNICSSAVKLMMQIVRNAAYQHSAKTTTYRVHCGREIEPGSAGMLSLWRLESEPVDRNLQHAASRPVDDSM